MKDTIKEMDSSRVQLVFSRKTVDPDTLDWLRKSGAFRVPTGLRRAAVDNVGVSAQEKIEGFDETKVKTLTVELELLLKYLRDFKVEQIELWISWVAETKGVLSLAIAAKGEGGVRVVLKPKENHDDRNKA